MAENGKSFPKIAESNWWKLRTLFKQTVPTQVTTTYLASLLSMTEMSARGNIIAPFKKLGIIDETGKPTDLAYDWRDDTKYQAVCNALLVKIYPQEVRDLCPSIDCDQTALNSWFMNYCRCGAPAAKMYTTFYRLLLTADPSGSPDVVQPKKKSTEPGKISRVRPTKVQIDQLRLPDAVPAGKGVSVNQENGNEVSRRLPQLHINIQLHISPETTAEQIDKIFDSMARHLKDFHL